MSAWRVARVLTRLVNIVVLVVSGAYLLVYLYRWEWNRAVISGVFFIAAEIALVSSLILDALRRDRGNPPAAVAAGADLIASANDGRPTRRFDWLGAQHDRFSVFIPVLLGAGVLLSGLAYVVERLAGALLGPAVDRRSAALLPLDLPLGDPTAAPRTVGAPTAVTASQPPARARRELVGWAVAAATATLLFVAAVDVLADATQSRPVPGPATGSTTVVMHVEQRSLARPPTEIAAALWTACRATADPASDLASARARGNRVELVIAPELGELRRRRLFGCLQDATLDRVRADVVSWANGDAAASG